MTDYSKITALYSRLSVGDEDRDGGESNSIQNQKIFLENYARGQHLTNIRHYIDDDESGRFFDRSAYSRMMDDVENGKIGVCIMKDLTRWGRDYLQVGNAMEIFRRNNVRFIAVNNGIDSEKPDTLEFAPFINIMSEWYAKDISKKVKTGIATEKGELNRSIQKTNRLIREIRAQIGKLKEWIADLFKVWETAPKQPPQSPNLANLLMKYLSVQREKSRKYSQRWQQQHTADELKTIAAAVNYLSEHGISNLDELDASLSSVSDRAYSIRAGMKTAEERMKKLQKLIEYGKNYTEYKPIHDELKKLQNGWTNKRDKYEEAHRAELTLWNAASRYLHANLPKGTKTLPIAEWEQEYADLKTQRDSDYTKLKDTRTNVSELQKIRKCVDIALRADQPEQTQSRTKRHDIDR